MKRRHRIDVPLLMLQDLAVKSAIQRLADESQRTRCLSAYDYLTTSDASAYAFWIHKHNTARRQHLQIDTWTVTNRSLPAKILLEPYLENCLWPQLYPFKHWCDSAANFKAGMSRRDDADDSDASCAEEESLEKRSGKASIVELALTTFACFIIQSILEFLRFVCCVLCSVRLWSEATTMVNKFSFRHHLCERF